MQYTSDIIGGGNDTYNGVQFDENNLSYMSDTIFINRISNILKNNDLTIISQKITDHKCLPDDDTFVKYFIDTEKGLMKNEDLFKRRILGLSSYFRSAQENLLPRYELNDNGGIYYIENCIMSDYQLGYYARERKKEDQTEKNKIKRKAINSNEEESSSTYRIRSRASCNFTYPEDIPRPMPMYQNTQNDNGEILNDDDLEVNKINEQFMEMKLYNEFDDDKEDDDDDDQNEDLAEGVLRRKIKRGKKKDDLSSEYPKAIIDSLKKLFDSDYLLKENLIKYSSKFSKILDNVQNDLHRGVHLLYSNFRTVEGVGILKLILEKNGFCEFKLRKTNQSWEIIENENDKGKQKFVLYTGTEKSEEKEIIRNVYNGNWIDPFVPQTIINKLQETDPIDKNLYGSVIKLMMITASGAEGINLKNTRYVHVVEPYWHMVRLQQVVGRARRICSHEDLPKELQTIKVFVYLSVLSETQKTNKSYLDLLRIDRSRFDDKTVTTDEYLFESAEKKIILIKLF